MAWLCVCLFLVYLCFGNVESTGQVKIPLTSFTCHGRAAGYYADMETGCQVYHMCDGLGRRFSYSCPKTTLFQQRMLVCDHWYMVNCSMAERDYDANLLIGQRDKPFVSDEEMSQRTPRPDILSVPLSSKYYDGLREAESKFPLHPGNDIVGVADTISNDEDNILDSGKKNYRPPTSWSTRNRKTNPIDNENRRSNPIDGNRRSTDTDTDNLTGAASQDPSPTLRPQPTKQPKEPKINEPNRELIPPLLPSTTEADVTTTTDSVYKFIKRFDPNSPDSIKTAITQSEIIDLNKHLPEGQISSEYQSSEEDRMPRKNKNFGNTFNDFKTENDKKFNAGTKFNSINTKPAPQNVTEGKSKVKEPERVLVPPKKDYSESPEDSSTVGPPIYYEWKWAVPAFGLLPPKESNTTNPASTEAPKTGESPFSSVRRTTIKDEDATPRPRNVEYNISSYFVPDYVFPLDNPHPGYDADDAQTSFQVEVARPGRSSYGENPNCPQCHPAYLNPGSCEPCIVKR